MMISKKPGFDPRQDDLPLQSLRTHPAFGTRNCLRLHEVQQIIGADSHQHVVNLIQEFEDTGGKHGLKGFSIGRDSLRGPDGKRTPRNCWRVAVSDLEAWLSAKAKSHL
jgi:hypothetical protein